MSNYHFRFDFQNAYIWTGYKTVGGMLKALMWAHDMTIESLSVEADVSVPVLKSIIEGRRVNMSALMARKISRALKCDINFFIDVIEENLK